MIRINFILYSILTYLSIGIYWVAISWSMLNTTNSPASIAYLLIINSLCMLLMSPILGMMVDKIGLRKITLLGQSLIASIGVIPFSVKGLIHHIPSFCLYITSFFFTAGTALCLASFDRALKLMIPTSKLRKIRTLLATCQQIALMIGTAVSGLLINRYLDLYVFLLITLISIFSLFLFQYLTLNTEQNIIEKNKTQETHWFHFLEGIRYISHDLNLIIAIISFASAYTVAQVINVTLPVFIKFDAGGTSSLFGSCEALWAFGGIIASLFVTLIINKINSARASLISLILLGTCLIALPFFKTNPSFILIACMTIGALFSTSKIIADANLLLFCKYEMIGRTRINTMTLTNFIGICIYTLPIISNKITPTVLYFSIGIMISLFSLSLIFISNPPNRELLKSNQFQE